MGTGSIRAGQAFIELSTRDTKLMKGLQNASARLKAFGRAVTETGRNMVMMWSAIAAPHVSEARCWRFCATSSASRKIKPEAPDVLPVC